jgi:uncharacterized protein DUF2568
MRAWAEGANAAVMFLLELGVYAAVGHWGYTAGSTWWAAVPLGAGGPALLVVVWAVFGAPKARVPLHGAGRVMLEILWFGSGVAATAAAGLVTTSVVFAAVFAGNALLRIVWNQV